MKLMRWYELRDLQEDIASASDDETEAWVELDGIELEHERATTAHEYFMGRRKALQSILDAYRAEHGFQVA